MPQDAISFPSCKELLLLRYLIDMVLTWPPASEQLLLQLVVCASSRHAFDCALALLEL